MKTPAIETNRKLKENSKFSLEKQLREMTKHARRLERDLRHSDQAMDRANRTLLCGCKAKRFRSVIEMQASMIHKWRREDMKQLKRLLNLIKVIQNVAKEGLEP